MSSNDIEKQIVEYRDYLYNYAYTLTNNRCDAEDLTQDVILQAINNKHTFIDDYNLKGWLSTIMRNKFINQWKTKQRRNDCLTNVEYLEDIPYFDNFTPHDNILYEELNKIYNLIDKDITACLTDFINGYKYEEISKMRNISLGTVKERIFRARRIIAESLTNYDYNIDYGKNHNVSIFHSKDRLQKYIVEDAIY